MVTWSLMMINYTLLVTSVEVPAGVGTIESFLLTYKERNSQLKKNMVFRVISKCIPLPSHTEKKKSQKKTVRTCHISRDGLFKMVDTIGSQQRPQG